MPEPLNNLSQRRSALHWLAILTCCATFPLIFMGGLVTSHQAGMSVPDWPNSFGYNMFLFPPRLWVGGILYEHTHRLMGTVVGALSIALAATAWRTEERPAVRRLAYAVLGAVIFQGVLGGLRVVLVKLDLAIVHACFAQAFFCLTALMVFVTAPRRQAPPVDPSALKTALRLALACVILIYLQLVIGATMRHYQAGLAIPDLPLAYGHILPPTSAAELKQANRLRLSDPALDPVTLSQIWLHFGHRLGALLVTAALAALIVHILRRQSAIAPLRNPALLLIALLALQLTLGVVVVLKRKPADIASLHVAVGALTLLTAFTLLLRSLRLRSAPADLPHPAVDARRAPDASPIPHASPLVSHA